MINKSFSLADKDCAVVVLKIIKEDNVIKHWWSLGKWLAEAAAACRAWIPFMPYSKIWNYGCWSWYFRNAVMMQVRFFKTAIEDWELKIRSSFQMILAALNK